MKLIEGWKQAHKLASVRLAALAGIVAGYFTAYPDQLATLIAIVPEEWRPVASVFAGLVVTTFAAGSRVASFKKGD